jgi:hypothetical protein
MSTPLSPEVIDLLRAVLTAIDIPYPATAGDEGHYQGGPSRTGDAHRDHPPAGPRAERPSFPTDELAWEAAYLCQQLAKHPLTGYNTGPWPGVPVDRAPAQRSGGGR